jgi:ketosteroid isomerase-like protein
MRGRIPVSDSTQARSSVTFDGGTERDRQELLDLWRAFLTANDDLDFELLATLWDESPGNVHFNTNGFTYYGLADWSNIWDFYRPQFRRLKPYSMGDTKIIIRGDTALILAEHVARYKEWVGGEFEHNPPDYRATQFLERKDGRWLVTHAHFSPHGEGLRPDQTPPAGPAAAATATTE